jgi:ribonuclease-3
VTEARTPPAGVPDYSELTTALGVPELDMDLLVHALTHRSYAYENGGLPTNERLEFLGDSVLGIIVTDRLFTSFPDLLRGGWRSCVRRWSTLVRSPTSRGRSSSVGTSGSDGGGDHRRTRQVLDPVRHGRGLIGAVYLQFGFARVPRSCCRCSIR